MGYRRASKSRVSHEASFADHAKAAFSRFLREDSGQAITEYVLLLSIVVMGAIALSKGLLAAVNRLTLVLGGQLEKDLKSGRAPLSVWRN